MLTDHVHRAQTCWWASLDRCLGRFHAGDVTGFRASSDEVAISLGPRTLDACDSLLTLHACPFLGGVIVVGRGLVCARSRPFLATGAPV